MRNILNKYPRFIMGVPISSPCTTSIYSSILGEQSVSRLYGGDLPNVPVKLIDGGPINVTPREKINTMGAPAITIFH